MKNWKIWRVGYDLPSTETIVIDLVNVTTSEQRTLLMDRKSPNCKAYIEMGGKLTRDILDVARVGTMVSLNGAVLSFA